MKTCSNCGFENSDVHHFCMKCGTPLDDTTFQNSSSNSPLYRQTQQTNSENNQRFKLLEENLSPAEGESEVKSYHCTSFKSALLNLKAEGHLVVTNKRVVFHASGISFAGKSILQSEVPIEDVSGISIYKGSYLSFMHMLGAFFLSVAIGGIANGILLEILKSIISSIMNNPQSITSDTLNSAQTSIQVVLWILAIGCLVVSFFLSRKNIFRSAFATTSFLLFVELGGLTSITSLFQSYILTTQSGGDNSWILILGVLVGLYALVCVFWYARRPTMSLTVGSKGGSSTPIAISGISSFGLYNTSASKALSAEPAEDAEALLKELGAMVMDIQILGDLGIKHWRSGTENQLPNSDTTRSS